jgi:hypothetical protein
MKRALIAILFVTFFLSLPVYSDARDSGKLAGETAKIAGSKTVAPLFLQIGRRRQRRMYRRAVVRRGRRIHRRRVVRRRRYIRRRVR